jgi:hypothetical protein
MDLVAKKGRESSAKTSLHGISKFLDVNRKAYFKDAILSIIPPDTTEGGGNTPFANDEIHRMFKASLKLRTKALVLYLASTGTRPQSLRPSYNSKRTCKTIINTKW